MLFEFNDKKRVLLYSLYHCKSSFSLVLIFLFILSYILNTCNLDNLSTENPIFPLPSICKNL